MLSQRRTRKTYGVRLDLFQLVVEVAFPNVPLDMQGLAAIAAFELLTAQKAAILEGEP